MDTIYMSIHKLVKWIIIESHKRIICSSKGYNKSIYADIKKHQQYMKYKKQRLIQYLYNTVLHKKRSYIWSTTVL